MSNLSRMHRTRRARTVAKTEIKYDYKRRRQINYGSDKISVPIAMPFSGGMDSFVAMLRLNKLLPDSPKSYFYFEGMLAPAEEYSVAEQIIGKENFLEVVQALDLSATARQPDPFIPFRNLYFALYIFGLGFRSICFAFNGEDYIYPDTTPDFSLDLQALCRKHINREIIIHTPLRHMSRIDMVMWIVDNYGKRSAVWDGLKESHSCFLFPPCRQCQTCFMREIAFSCVDDYIHNKKEFIQHWTQDIHRTIVERLYWECRTGRYKYNKENSVGLQYLEYLNEFGNGVFLKAL